MSTTKKPKQRPVARAPVTTGPSGSPTKTGFNNRRLAVVAALVTTAIIAAVVLLFNIGSPGSDEQTQNPNVEPVAEFDPGPPWQPNQSALEQQLNTNPTTDPETEFAGIPAPQWQPSSTVDKTVDGFGLDHFEAVEEGSDNELLPRSNFASDYDWLVANGLG